MPSLLRDLTDPMWWVGLETALMPILAAKVWAKWYLRRPPVITTLKR